MTLIIMVLRKITKNVWIMGSLFIGILISVALISSIPVYTDGILQRMIVKELEEYQKINGIYPGGYISTVSLPAGTTSQKRSNLYNDINPYMQKQIPKLFDIPVLSSVNRVSLAMDKLTPQDAAKKVKYSNSYAKIEAMSDFEKHIIITDGRIASHEKIDGVYEAMVPEKALSKLNMVLNTPFILTDIDDINSNPIKVIPVGTFSVKDERDLYWNNSPETFDESFIINFDLFKKDFIDAKNCRINTFSTYYAFDYHDINVNNISQVIGAQEEVEKQISKKATNFYITAPSELILSKLMSQEKQLRTMLWSLYVPILIMLCFYLAMVSMLIVGRQHNEIAVLRSRGASRAQIVSDYFVEGLILGGLAYLIGPWVALFLGKILGSSSGFLEVVQRNAVKISLNKVAYMYAAFGVAVSIIMLMIPAYLATGMTIVGHQQTRSRSNKKSVWEKLFIDFLLIGIAIYGLYSFQSRQANLLATGIDASALQVDPLLFFIPTLFILGVGLLFIRIYPWILKLVYWIGHKIWAPSIYAILIQVGRSTKQYHFIMIFLIISIATGLFGANAARTINQNEVERIYYKEGADIVLESHWDSDSPLPASGEAAASAKESAALTDEELLQAAGKDPKKILYKEPPFAQYTQLVGVEYAAKIFRQKTGSVEASGRPYEGIEVMAIDPYDFGHTAWLRNDLLSYHINNYLNFLSDEPSAVIISKSLSVQAGLKVGDYLSMTWADFEPATFTVSGIVDYWPGWNPNRDPKDPPGKIPMLVVANLLYTQDNIAFEPYEIWLKMKPNTLSANLYADIQKKSINVVNMEDTKQKIIEEKNAPFQLAINGALTLGFVISMLICLNGFLLYWILSLRSHTLQFGIFQAMGISKAQLFTMIGIEQILTSGMAIIIGMIIGDITSKLFVPLFQITSSASTQVPPFRVVSELGDLIKIYMWVGGMLILGLAILGFMAFRIKIAQAVKLGED